MKFEGISFSQRVKSIVIVASAIVFYLIAYSNALAADTVSSAQYLDSNVNGTVETVRFTMDENVTACAYEAGDWTVNTASEMNLAITGLSCTGTDAYLDITVTADSLETGHTTAPVFSYTQATGTANSVTLTAGPMTDKASQTITDGAAPQISSLMYMDIDDDGKIDRARISFSETAVSSSVLAPENLDFTDVGDFTGIAFTNSVTDAITASSTYEDFTFTGAEASVVDTYEGSGTIAFTTQDATANFQLVDGTGNTNTTPKVETQAQFLDGAKPVIKSTTPTDGSSVQSRTNSIVWTFSEPMATAGGWVHAEEFTSDPNPGGWGTVAWTSSNTVATVTHSPFLCITSYSITTDNTQIDAVNGEAAIYTALNDASTAPIGAALTFTTMSCSGTSSSGSSSTTTYSVSVESPEIADELIADEYATIEWEASPEGEYYIDLYYLDANGDYELIAENQENTGSYEWLVPSDLSGESNIYLDWTDLSSSLDTATSGTFTVIEADSDEEQVSSEAGSTGTNPFTGETEEIDDVSAGDFISSPETDTVYYIDSDLSRRPFMNSQVYFTWADSWSEVDEVTGATLASLELGDVMLPKAGVVMVKIQSNAKTYAVEGDGILRWVISEDVAQALYGTSWNAYIIDIEPTFFSKFTIGDDIEDEGDYLEHKETTVKSRAELSE